VGDLQAAAYTIQWPATDCTNLTWIWTAAVVDKEVAAELSTVFSQQEYRVVDSIQEGKFSDGKPLLKVLF